MENVQTTIPPFPDFRALLESVRESGRRMDANYERYLKEQAERDAKWKEEQAERDAKWKEEQAERDAKWKEEQAERDAKWEKERTERDAKLGIISKDTKDAIREMKDVFTTQWGRLVEALCKPAAFALFKREGIEIDRIYEGVHKAKEDGQDVMEIDVALCDTTVAVIVEVKSRCDNHDIDYFLRQMQHCKEWYKEFADKDLYVAVAAIDYAGGADTYAKRKGLYVLKLTGEETFTMQSPDRPTMF